MKILILLPMKFLMVFVASSLSAAAQTLPVDWLLPAQRMDGSFLLVDDSSHALGGAALSAVVGFPLESGITERREGSQWLDSSLVPTNAEGTQTVEGFRMRVAPFGGTPNWSLNITAEEAGDWYLVVGSLYRDASASHGPLQILATEGGNTVQLEFLGSSAWNGGVGSFLGALDWNGITGELSPQVGNEGESGMAFFRMESFGGSDSEIVINVPAGFDAGAAGDDVFFAVGRAIPEPSSMMLLVLPCLAAISRRRRRSIV